MAIPVPVFAFLHSPFSDHGGNQGSEKWILSMLSEICHGESRAELPDRVEFDCYPSPWLSIQFVAKEEPSL